MQLGHQHKTQPVCFTLLFGFSLLLTSTLHAEAADWMLRREDSNGACHVQMKTADALGSDLSGPFSSRKAACLDAASRYEAATSDPKKCGTYGGGTVSGCVSDGVTLPPKG